MRKKKDGCFKKIDKKIFSLSICINIRKFYERIKKKVTNSPAYKKFLQKRNKLTNRIRDCLLAFFGFFGPCWSFLCIKTPDIDETTGVSNEIRYMVIQTKSQNFITTGHALLAVLVAVCITGTESLA